MSNSEVKLESTLSLSIRKATPVFLLGHVYLFYIIFTYNISAYNVQIHIVNYLFILLWPSINIAVSLMLLVTRRWRCFFKNTLLCTISIFYPMYLPLYFR